MGKFSEALGEWEIKIEGREIVLMPELEDVRNFRKVMTKQYSDPTIKLDKFGDYMFNLIRRFYPEEDINQTKFWIELHINELLERTMLAFRWITEEELAKSKNQTVAELKKKLGIVDSANEKGSKSS